MMADSGASFSLPMLKLVHTALRAAPGALLAVAGFVGGIWAEVAKAWLGALDIRRTGALMVVVGLLYLFALYATRDRAPSQRAHYRRELQKLSVWIGSLISRLSAAKTDEQAVELIEEAEKLHVEAHRWIMKDMGAPAYAKFISGSYNAVDMVWSGEHDVAVHRQRVATIMTLRLRADGIEALIKSADWDPEPEGLLTTLRAKFARSPVEA